MQICDLFAVLAIFRAAGKKSEISDRQFGFKKTLFHFDLFPFNNFCYKGNILYLFNSNAVLTNMSFLRNNVGIYTNQSTK